MDENSRKLKESISHSQDNIGSTIEYIQNVLHKEYFKPGGKEESSRKIQSMCLEIFDCYTKQDRINLVFDDIYILEKFLMKSLHI